MAVYRESDPVIVRRSPIVVERGSDLTGYAFVKYAFILAITLVVLYFIARYLLPMAGR